MSTEKVAVVTVTYGDRCKFLSQVVDAVMKDEHVVKLVLVDNGSKNENEIKSGIVGYGDKIKLLRQEKNLGPGAGFSAGLEYARNIDCDYVFILDDDNVPEADTISKFLEIKKTFGDKKVILVGNRVDIGGSQRYFYKTQSQNITGHAAYFEVFSLKKVINFLRLLTGLNRKVIETRGPFNPIVPIEIFSYGGSFIPINAVREAPLPDTSFVLYGDDGEYSWGLNRLGYSPYLCHSPVIHDVDLTISSGSTVSGYFDPKTQPFKVYYHIKNSVRISRIHNRKTKLVLFLNILFWNIGLCILGTVKYGFNAISFSRIKLIARAVYDGYYPDNKAPNEVKLP